MIVIDQALRDKMRAGYLAALERAAARLYGDGEIEEQKLPHPEAVTISFAIRSDWPEDVLPC